MLPVAPSESSQGGLASPSEFARDLGPLVGAIDQGLTSSRFLVFSASTAELVTYHQEPVATSSPRPGWVEQDPAEILESVRTCIDATVDNLRKLDGEREWMWSMVLDGFYSEQVSSFPCGLLVLLDLFYLSGGD